MLISAAFLTLKIIVLLLSFGKPLLLISSIVIIVDPSLRARLLRQMFEGFRQSKKPSQLPLMPPRVPVEGGK
jgi:hypothetical protein